MTKLPKQVQHFQGKGTGEETNKHSNILAKCAKKEENMRKKNKNQKKTKKNSETKMLLIFQHCIPPPFMNDMNGVINCHSQIAQVILSLLGYTELY